MTHFSDGVRVGANFSLNGTATVPGVATSAIYVYSVAPAALSATAVAAAQAVAGAGNLTINGAKASGGVATFDVPRACSIVSSGAGDTTQTATVYGTDVYGVALVETIAFNGTTTVNGKKAFKTVTRVAISAALAGNASVGSTDILGLPYAAASRNYVQTAVNGAFVTTGTFAGSDATTATATTGDVRGTFAPATATDGSKIYTMWIWIVDPDTRAGIYGVSQYGG